jgi:hypothetical protein
VLFRLDIGGLFSVCPFFLQISSTKAVISARTPVSIQQKTPILGAFADLDCQILSTLDGVSDWVGRLPVDSVSEKLLG